MTLEEHPALQGQVPAEPPVEGSRAAPSLVPDLIGLEARSAYALARAAGVRLNVSVWQTIVGPWGLVLEQTLEAGTRVRRGTRLRVVVSGRPYQAVPDVSGLPLETAIEQLGWLGFVPLTTARRRSLEQAVGHVITTTPAPGTLLAYGSVVALTVASPMGRTPAAVDEHPSRTA